MNFILGLLVAILFYIAYILTKSYETLKEINGYDKQKQSDEYTQTVQIQKTKKPKMEAVKQIVRGRSVTKTDDLVDIAYLGWEDGTKAIEEMTNG